MKLTFTAGQIETGRKLIRWLVKDHKYELDAARLETGKLLVRYSHQKIKSAMNSTACTSPLMLKKILEQRETFKNSKTYA